MNESTYNSDEALKLGRQLCFPLYAASRKITAAYQPLLKPLHLTYTQYIVFMALWEKDDIPVGELCQKLRLDTGTLTPLLKKMENAGWLTRTRGQKDERVVFIKLTEEGRALKEKARMIPLRMGQCVSKALTDEEMKELYRLLYKVLDS